MSQNEALPPRRFGEFLELPNPFPWKRRRHKHHRHHHRKNYHSSPVTASSSSADATIHKDSPVTSGGESPSYAAVARMGKDLSSASYESSRLKTVQQNQEFPPLPTPCTPTITGATVAVPDIVVTEATPPQKKANKAKEDDNIDTMFYLMRQRTEAAGLGNSPFLPQTPAEYMQLQDRFRARKMIKSKKRARLIEEETKAGNMMRQSRQSLATYSQRGSRLVLTKDGDFKSVHVDTRPYNDWPRDKVPEMGTTFATATTDTTTEATSDSATKTTEETSSTKTLATGTSATEMATTGTTTTEAMVSTEGYLLIPGSEKCLFSNCRSQRFVNRCVDSPAVRYGRAYHSLMRQIDAAENREFELKDVNGWLAELILHIDVEDSF